MGIGELEIMAAHECIHEERMQNLSRKLSESDARADYRDRRIDELNTKMDKMEEKLDKLSDSMNELVLQSTKDDKNLELRLKAIETELTLQKQTATANHNRVSSLLAVVGVGLSIITILINVYFNMLP